MSSLPPRRAQTSHDRGRLRVTYPPPAPACAHRPQPGRSAGQVSPLQVTPPPPRRAQTGHSRGELPVQCPPSRPGSRRPATAGVSCLSRVLPPAPVCAQRPQPGHAASQVSPLPPRRARTNHDPSELPIPYPPPAPACANQPRPERAAYPVSPSRPVVRKPAEGGACGRSSVPPQVPPCANQPRPGRPPAR